MKVGLEQNRFLGPILEKLTTTTIAKPILVLDGVQKINKHVYFRSAILWMVRRKRLREC